MSEDVSATMRVGITVILVAALVAVVLNLMVMSNSLLSGGQTTLQSGVDSVSQQEFAAYNNTKVSGTQVNTALSLFQGRDVAILIQTKALREAVHGTGTTADGTGFYMNYGALISELQTKSDEATKKGGIKTTTDSGSTKTEFDTNGATAKFFIAEGSVKFPLTDDDLKSFVVSLFGNNKSALYGVMVGNSDAPTSYPVTQKEGQPNKLALLYDANGVVQSSNNTIGTATLGNYQYLLTSARFQSILIKDATGSINGICFYQIN